MKMTGPRSSRQYVSWRKIPNEVRDDPGVPLLPQTTNDVALESLLHRILRKSALVTLPESAGTA